MKTSNKILLGILLIGFGYLACAQFALHIKYVNNDFTPAARYNDFFYDEHRFNTVKYVHIKGLAECNIIYAGSVKLSVEKSGINYVNFNITGDTLIIDGQYGSGLSANYKLNSSPQNVVLYMPHNIDIYALNSNIYIKGGIKEEDGRSYNFYITGSNLFTRRNYGLDSLDRYFETFSVDAKKNSRVEFFHNDHFKSVDLQLDQSQINDYHAKINQVNINADSSSVVVITGTNIGKLNSTAIKK